MPLDDRSRKFMVTVCLVWMFHRNQHNNLIAALRLMRDEMSNAEHIESTEPTKSTESTKSVESAPSPALKRARRRPPNTPPVTGNYRVTKNKAAAAPTTKRGRDKLVSHTPNPGITKPAALVARTTIQQPQRYAPEILREDDITVSDILEYCPEDVSKIDFLFEVEEFNKLRRAKRKTSSPSSIEIQAMHRGSRSSVFTVEGKAEGQAHGKQKSHPPIVIQSRHAARSELMRGPKGTLTSSITAKRGGSRPPKNLPDAVTKATTKAPPNTTSTESLIQKALEISGDYDIRIPVIGENWPSRVDHFGFSIHIDEPADKIYGSFDIVIFEGSLLLGDEAKKVKLGKALTFQYRGRECETGTTQRGSGTLTFRPKGLKGKFYGLWGEKMEVEGKRTGRGVVGYKADRSRLGWAEYKEHMNRWW
ncbi:hypothetical protein P154DRAFT_559827 [Amniculicola lignicola CBS 123094]|uniref:Uncharacterized protein n=1 Tax=Amniculicola lignicola CBS 123094 TaxID=1392246 RepID=A0A6A5WVP6_9PLEO|nr:hypothetical protein P154DRAFT_559827 [Amniculicola lignicola CBS 123094]